ncbi:MAG: hypothetical protein Q4E74_11615, partial [Ruminococcus sp.]|nr:hypothetical protein [Ruminococcus sp.]
MQVDTENMEIEYINISGHKALLSYDDDSSIAVLARKYRTEAHEYVYSGSKYEYLEVNSGTL